MYYSRLQRIKQEKRQKDAQRKQKVTENRKHLANVRVVQKNLVFVVGLSTRLADAEVSHREGIHPTILCLILRVSMEKYQLYGILYRPTRIVARFVISTPLPFQTLKKPDYFGKFGKIHKVVINHSTSYAGSQVSYF